MKKHQINTLLINQTKRRNTVLTYSCVIAIVFFLALSLLVLFVKNNKTQYVTYTENGNIDYKVQYKDNEYFEENMLDSNRQYISSLINNINADFNYRISLDDSNVEYKYSGYSDDYDAWIYICGKIEEGDSFKGFEWKLTDSKEKTTKNVYYEKTDILVPKTEETSTVEEVVINENIIIDYNKYNDLIKKFVSIYDLENAESTLNVNMYINVLGTCEDFAENTKKERVISLTIPLTKENIAIDFVDDIVNSSNNVMKCTSAGYGNTVLLFVSITLIVAGVCLIILLVRYEVKTRTAETIYEKELKKILNNYGSSIQMIKNEFDFEDYQLLKIDNFYDLLEISDKLRQPILMKENKERNGAYFILPSTTKLLYVYRLKVSDIEKEINKNI